MGCKVVLGDICSFSRGASIPRARMHDTGDYLYIHYGDLYNCLLYTSPSPRDS